MGKKKHNTKQQKKQNTTFPFLNFTYKDDKEQRQSRPPIYPHSPRNQSDYLQSILDKPDVDHVRSGDFDGAIHLGFVIIVFACVRLVMINIQEHGFLFESFIILPCLTFQFIKVMAIYLIEALGTFSLYIAYKLFALKKLQKQLLFAFYIFLQIAYLLIPLFILPAMPPMAKIFSICYQLILQLKMHSYIMTNYHLELNIKQKFKQIVQQAKMRDREFLNKNQSIRKQSDKVIQREARLSIKNQVKDMKVKNLSSAKDLKILDEAKAPPPSVSFIYPNNLTFVDYLRFIFLVPVLVYEAKYVVTQKIRWLYVLKQLIALQLCGIIALIMITQFCLPIVLVDTLEFSLIKSIPNLINLVIATLFVWLLGFYAFFHCMLNLASQLSYFGDRQFYRDWWNSTTIDQFWRKWNIPVHEWCLRHLYIECIYHFKTPASLALLLVFFVSAILHEYIFSFSFLTFTPYFFLGMLVQAPLIYINQFFGVKKKKEGKARSKRWGNITMWISLLIGQPLLEIMYFRDWFVKIGGGSDFTKSFFCTSWSQF